MSSYRIRIVEIYVDSLFEGLIILSNEIGMYSAVIRKHTRTGYDTSQCMIVDYI